MREVSQLRQQTSRALRGDGRWRKIREQQLPVFREQVGPAGFICGSPAAVDSASTPCVLIHEAIADR